MDKNGKTLKRDLRCPPSTSVAWLGVAKKTLAASLLIGLMAPLQSHASLLAYEGFDYTAGDNLVSMNGGAGWSGGWQNIYNATSGVLNYGSLTAGANAPAGYDARSTGNSGLVPNMSGSGRMMDCSAAGVFASHGYIDASGRIGKDGTTLYISFLQQPSTTVGTAYYEWRLQRGGLGDGGRIAGIGNDNGVDNAVYLRAPNGTKNLSLGAATTDVNLYVIKIVYKAGNDDIYVYRNPASGTEAGNTPTLTKLAQADMSFDGIAMAAFNGGVTINNDQIRMGESWGDVIGGAPGFITQPSGFVSNVGDSVILNASALSDLPINYQWYRGSSAVANATSTALSLPSMRVSDSGRYTLVASNSMGCATSVVSVVSVIDPNAISLLGYEGFDYTPGSVLAGQNGGAGWNGVWQQVNNASAVAASGNLSAGASSPEGYDARSTGNAALVNNNTRSGRLLDTSATGTFGSHGYVDSLGRIGADGKVLYLSFLQQPSTTVGGAYYEFEFHRGNLGDAGRIAGIGNDTGAADSVNLRAPNGVKNLSLGTATTAVNFYVVKIIFNSGADDIYVYRNPTGARESDNTPTLVKLAQADMSFDGLSMGTFNSGCTVSDDQIRLGESWSSVIGGAPGFITQPKGMIAHLGDSGSLTATAISDQAINYQWYKGTTPLALATGTTLPLSNLRLSDAGNYSVVAANSLGSVTSVVAVVSVLNTNNYLLCYEGFDYDSSISSVANLNGGAGWSGAWVNIGDGYGNLGNGSMPITAGNLIAGANAPGGYDARSTGNSCLINTFNRAGRFVDCSTNGTFAMQGLVDGNGRIGADGTSLYISFLQQPTATNGSTSKFYEFEFHRDNLGDPGRTAGIGNDSATSSIYLRAPSTTTTLIGAGDPAVNLYVMRIDYLPGADTAYIYRNPTGAGESANTPILTMNAVADLSFNGIALAAYDQSVTVKHDQIRMGLSWADVIGGAPGFVQQPVKQTTNYNQSTATLSALAISDLPVSYQWYHGNSRLEGATSSTLSLPNLQAADAGNYWVSASNSLGLARSTVASLTLKALEITNQPINQLSYLNGNYNQSLTLTSGAAGYQVAYQWYFNGALLAGATSSSLTLSGLQVAHAGNYYVVASNGSGSVTSSVATVTIYGVSNNVFAYDGFAYDADLAIDGSTQNGGFGWAGGWNPVDGNAVYISGGSLSGGANVPTDYEARSTGNCVEVYGVSRSGRYVDCNPSGTLAKQGFIDANGNLGANGKTVYISFLQQPMSTAWYYEFEFHRGNLSDPGRIGGIGNDTDTQNVNLRAPGGTHTPIGIGDTGVNFYVVRIDYKAGNDDVHVYRNPTSGSEPAVATLAMTNVADMSFNGISVAAFRANDVKHDEIRVGATWDDAIGLAVSNLLPPTQTSDGIKVRFAATPGYAYRIQRAADITGQWTDIATVTGTEIGYVEYLDTTAPAGQSFYRTVVGTVAP